MKCCAPSNILLGAGAFGVALLHPNMLQAQPVRVNARVSQQGGSPRKG